MTSRDDESDTVFSRITAERCRKFCSDDHGGEAVEWPLMVALIILIAIGAWSQFQDNLGEVVTAITEAVTAVLD
ncbi:hypothetical protein THIOKS12210010 [Thiocapsa sp. KS1]|nr:hypothetical protein [Thiocapsa sp. KS1]CRI64965.1 hypothetical protein THIOKS12210010 [Thiocapsa sp. KS1]